MEVETKKAIASKQVIKQKSAYVWLGTYITVAASCIVAHFLIKLDVFVISGKYHELLQKFFLAGFLGVLILSAFKFIEILILKKSRSKYKRYNLIRLTHLISFIAVAILMVTFLFDNWYAAAVSLGLFSLLLGFALQTPISSFIGWVYIIIRNPYRIGDRIQIDTIKGDIIEIGYLDTTLWEFAGDYLTNDLPSGRLIRFPNSLVFQSAVFNYSWKNFEYIWNEIPFHVAYESDLDYVEKTIRGVTKDELGEKTEQRIEELKKLVKESPIDDLEIKEYPYVSLRINTNTWVEATVTYLVPPKQAASIRTRIIKRVISSLRKQSEKTMFPQSNAR